MGTNIAILLSGLLIVVAGNASASAAAPAPPPSPLLRIAADAGNAFGLELYAQLRDSKDNVFFSPYSLACALAMAYEGARGDTAAQMAKALHFPGGPDVVREAFSQLVNRLNGEAKQGCELSTANALWAQSGYALLPAYVNALQTFYQAPGTIVDFIRAPVQACAQINAWTAQQTANRIPEIITPQSVSAATRLVLTNAVYFKGAWVSPFEKRATKDLPFYVTPDNPVNTPLMHKKAFFRLGYTETPEVQALGLAYKAPALSMVVILPKALDGLAAFERTLTPPLLTKLLDAMVGTEVELYLPKFQWSTSYGLRSILAAMGMPTAFDGGVADFSGMTGNRELFISDVLHKTFLEVNEEGTEAAAVTAIPMAATAAPMKPKPNPVFRADHPFLFLIRENQSGAILFMGRYLHPVNAGS